MAWIVCGLSIQRPPDMSEKHNKSIELAQWLRTLVSLPGNLGSVPRGGSQLSLVPEDPAPFSSLLGQDTNMVCIHTLRNVHTHANE